MLQTNGFTWELAGSDLGRSWLTEIVEFNIESQVLQCTQIEVELLLPCFYWASLE